MGIEGAGASVGSRLLASGLPKTFTIPRDRNDVNVTVGGCDVRLTNLRKPFWPDLKITKGDLLQYYADVAPVLLPHIESRAMVMRRYPNGAAGESFFMKEAPSPRPPWIRICPIHHNDEKIVNFPVIDDLPSLLWVVNLGCIDLNQWYARCDDYNRPDYLHFDLDPSPGATFAQVLESALVVRDALETLKMKPLVKTSGSRGCHVHVPIVRGQTQDDVLAFTKALAFELASRHPRLLTVEYRKTTRPKSRVLVDYRQNAWGQTLASIYSVRPTPHASVSTPLTWAEVEKGVAIEDFRIDNVRARITKVGDLWKPLLAARGRVNLTKFFAGGA
jgi:bifunctional non-homologous end joining protein LigD